MARGVLFRLSAPDPGYPSFEQAGGWRLEAVGFEAAIAHLGPALAIVLPSRESCRADAFRLQPPVSSLQPLPHEAHHRHHPAQQAGRREGGPHRGRGRSADDHGRAGLRPAEGADRGVPRPRDHGQPAAQGAAADRRERGFRRADDQRHHQGRPHRRAGPDRRRQDLRPAAGRLHPHPHRRTRAAKRSERLAAPSSASPRSTPAADRAAARYDRCDRTCSTGRGDPFID